MNDNSHDCHHRKTTRTFIYTKSKKNSKRFIYKKQDTFQKARQFPLRFYIQKSRLLTLRDFHEIFEIAIYIYKKHDTLRYVTFLYTKSQTLRKKQDNLRYVFIYKIRHFCATRFFIEFLKFAEGGGHFIYLNNVLSVTFLY